MIFILFIVCAMKCICEATCCYMIIKICQEKNNDLVKHFLLSYLITVVFHSNFKIFYQTVYCILLIYGVLNLNILHSILFNFRINGTYMLL
jgi:hypothetical protein